MTERLASPTHRLALFWSILAVWLTVTLMLLPLDAINASLSSIAPAVAGMYDLMVSVIGFVLFILSACVVCLTPWVLCSRFPSSKFFVASVPFLWVLYHWIYESHRFYGRPPKWSAFRFDPSIHVTLGWVGVAAAIATPFIVAACWQMLNPSSNAKWQMARDDLAQRRSETVEKHRIRQGRSPMPV